MVRRHESLDERKLTLPLVATLAALLANPLISTPGRAGTKNGSVTWTGGVCDVGPCVNPWTNALAGTNKLLWTQDFANAAWTKTTCGVTAQVATLAPDGTRTLSKFVSTAGNVGVVYQSVAKSASAVQTWTGFVILRAAERTTAIVQIGDGAGTNRSFATFNTATGLPSAVTNGGTFTGTAKMVDLLDGSFRCEMTVVTGAEANVRIEWRDSAAGDGTAGIHVWAMKLEVGNTATTYYPNMGVVAGMPIYVRRAMPGFAVPRVPLVVWNGSKWMLDAPFRHDFRIGQNMLINSAWSGAVAGAPGTAPTSWASSAAGTPSLSIPAPGQLTFSCPAAGVDNRYIDETITVAANTTYIVSVRILDSPVGLKLWEVVKWGSTPAGSVLTYTRNGVAANETDVIFPGDTVASILAVAGTAGTARSRIGNGTSGPVSVAGSVTLCCPQVEPGVLRSVYTPTTTAAISAPVCEPVRESEQGIYVAWHAQGTRMNLVNAMASLNGTSSSVLSGARRVITEDATNAQHFVYSSSGALVDGAMLTRRAVVSRVSGTRNILLKTIGGTSAAGVVVNLDTLALTDDVSGSGAVSNKSITSLGGGRYAVSFNVTAAAWGAAPTNRAYMLSTVSYTYQGDGTSALAIESDTLEAASFSGIPLGEGTARTTDNIVHNFAMPLSTVAGEIAAVATPYAWSAAAGGANPTGGPLRYFYSPAVNTIYRDNGGGDAAIYTDAGGNQVVVATSVAKSSGVSNQHSLKYDQSLRLYNGASLAGTDSTGITAPWASVTTLRIASDNGSLHFFGTVAPFIFDGRTATDGERALLANALDGKAQTVMA